MSYPESCEMAHSYGCASYLFLDLSPHLMLYCTKYQELCNMCKMSEREAVNV
jgi:hypothetical protein